jgi:LytS/YehU family sensor histidine kinase
MAALVPPQPPQGLARILALPRLLLALVVSALLGLVISVAFPATSAAEVMARELPVGLATLMAFGLFEKWPERLPPWLARWFIQVAAVAFVIPFTVLAIYLVITQGDAVPLWRNSARVNGFFTMTMTGLLVAPWIAVAALFNQRERERGELERKALDSRLRLLQARVEPHFLFNTLANVRELVDSGSPQATTVLDSLIAYLRAAVPRLHETETTVGQEVQLARAYLELMQMRMPDRLQFAMDIDAAALDLRCPPTTLLTLVENAVRHGIDPSEEGGRIDVQVRVQNSRCLAEVRDTGVGLQPSSEGLGTGLATLRERLELAFGSNVQVRISSLVPRGVCVSLDLPARTGAA